MRSQCCGAAAFSLHMIIQSSSQGAVQSTEVVSHHFSSFVLSRRAVDPQVHVRALHLRSDNVYFLLAGLRMKRLIRCSQDKLCQMRLQFLLGGGRNTGAP